MDLMWWIVLSVVVIVVVLLIGLGLLVLVNPD